MSLPLHRWLCLALLCLASWRVASGEVPGDRAAAEDENHPRALTRNYEALQGAIGDARPDRVVLPAGIKTAEAQVVLQKYAAVAGQIVKEVQAANDAQAGQVVQTIGLPGSNVAVPREVDPNDPVQRFAVLTPVGPLVVSARITVEGAAFRKASETIIDELLKVVDRDGDGKITWEQALKNPRFTMGRLRPMGNNQQLAQYVKAFDVNGDGLVDRYETRRMAAQLAQLSAFQGHNFVGYRAGTSDLREVLDTDRDGTLSAEEIDAAPQRLKALDADDNDLLYPQELGGAVNVGGNPRPTTTASPLLLVLGDTTPPETVLAALVMHYGDPQQQTQVTARTLRLPGLFAALDGDNDGILSAEEAAGLNTIAPHVELEVEFDGQGQPRVTRVAGSGLWEHSLPDGGGVLLTAPGVRIRLAITEMSRRQYNYDAVAQQQVARLDKNNNGYIDANEIDNDYTRQMVAVWDADQDGRVYPKEIVAYYNYLQAPMLASIRAMAVQEGNALFQTLDQTGDGRLSLREMRSAAERLRTLDANGDGRLGEDEIPTTILVTLARGGFSGYSGGTGTLGRQPGGRAPAAAQGPDWFVRMDRNGDGDVTLKEFLGTEEQFRKLDRNGDGFIDRTEAEAAGKP